jgi:hypothetical protein
MRKGQAVNAFETHLLDSWSECTELLGRRDLLEFERRVEALIAVLERCQDRTWIAAAC